MTRSATAETQQRRDPGFWRRLWAMVLKEFIQMRRDRLTFATMLAIPILQLVLFGYAINRDPQPLATAALARHRAPAAGSLAPPVRPPGYGATAS